MSTANFCVTYRSATDTGSTAKDRVLWRPVAIGQRRSRLRSADEEDVQHGVLIKSVTFDCHDALVAARFWGCGSRLERR